MFLSLYNFPRPTIAAVNGPAIGGGCGLANACDITIAAEKAVFGYPEVKIGFVPAIVSIFLMTSIGPRKAKDLLLTGRIVSAGEALALGLINAVAGNDAVGKGLAIAESLLDNAPSSVAMTKNFCNKIAQTELSALLEEASALNAESRLQENFKEGITAFLEKRKPKWTG